MQALSKSHFGVVHSGDLPPPEQWGRVGVGGVVPIGEIASTPTSILPHRRGRRAFLVPTVEL
jgi:hypothetical protein